MIGESLASASLEKALQQNWKRQRLIAENVANVDTPGYKAKRIDFEGELKKKIENVRKKRGVRYEGDELNEVKSYDSHTYSLDHLTSRLDGNNVDMDSEQAELARAQIHYNYLVQKINGHYSRLKYVISEGKR